MVDTKHYNSSIDFNIIDNLLLTRAELVIPIDAIHPQSIIDKIRTTEPACTIENVTAMFDNSHYLLCLNIEILPSFFCNLYVFDHRDDQNSIKIVFEPMKDMVINIDQDRVYKRIRAIYEFLDHVVDGKLEKLIQGAYFSRVDFSWDCEAIKYEDYGHLLEISPYTDTPNIVSQDDCELKIGPDHMGRNFIFSNGGDINNNQARNESLSIDPCMRVTVIHEANLPLKDIFEMENPYKRLHCFNLSKNLIPTELKKYRKESNFYLLPSSHVDSESKNKRTKTYAKAADHLLNFVDKNFVFVYPTEEEWSKQRDYTIDSIQRVFLAEPIS